MKLDSSNNYNKKYFFDNEKPFCIYNPDHNRSVNTIYANGIINAVNIIQQNVLFRNAVHFSPKCRHVKELIKNEFKIAYNNNFGTWVDLP